MLQPILHRTQAPKGKTPLLYESISHSRLSVISAVSLSPKRQKLSLFWKIQSYNFTAEDLIDFLRRLRKSIPSKITLIWDRYSVHKKVLKEYSKRHQNLIKVEWLPTYAPELNPTEGVWRHTKYNQLPNTAPFDLVELNCQLKGSLGYIKSQQYLLRSFFKKAGLVL